MRSRDHLNKAINTSMALHTMEGPPGFRCTCGTLFDDYQPLAEHVRQSINCPCCGATPAVLRNDACFRWMCGHWIASDEASATLRSNEILVEGE